MEKTYEEKRQDALYEYENEVRSAVDDSNSTYDSMIADSDKAYQEQIASLESQKNNTDPLSQSVQEQTDFAIKEIEQQKEQAAKDYTKEQGAAYVDYKKQTNPYGANAEQMAAMGMTGSGYSESSMVSMYNTYQNRVAAARESYGLAVQNYNNAITEARLQNNSTLAQIAANALAKQLELSIQMVEKRNTLIQGKVDQKLKIDSEYYSRYKDVLQQIYDEQGSGGTGITGSDNPVVHIGANGTISPNQTGSTAMGGALSTGGVTNNSKEAQAVMKGEDYVAPGTVNNEILNNTGNGFVEIPGHGWYTYSQLLALVNQGKVKETMVNGKYKYTWVQPKQNPEMYPKELTKTVSK